MTEAELAELVDAFEAGDLPLEAWHHREHLLVALAYLRRYPRAQALDRLCAGIQRFNARWGIAQTRESGYHETLTRVLGQAVARVVRQRTGEELAVQVDAVVEALADWRAVVRPHYSRERLLSWEARRTWVEPDLAPLP